jgi:O-antigen ligase
LGLGLTVSRAGAVLAVIGSLAALAMAWRAQGHATSRGLVATGIAIFAGFVVFVQFALSGLLDRAATSALNDLRFEIAKTTIVAGGVFQPLGSGFGTFVPVYELFEGNSTLNPSYINHAHNDWLELWLEGGWPAIVLVLAFLWWLGVGVRRAWQSRDRDAARPFDRFAPQAASITIILLMLHSLVDYPLRTTALSTLFAFCCALLVPPGKRYREPSPANPHRAHSSTADTGDRSGEVPSSRRGHRVKTWDGAGRGHA